MLTRSKGDLRPPDCCPHLLATLQEVRGKFDRLGSMDRKSKEYWQALEGQMERYTIIKHMFESTWYKCGKLNAGLLLQTSDTQEMESAALPHVLAWLGKSWRE